MHRQKCFAENMALYFVPVRKSRCAWYSVGGRVVHSAAANGEIVLSYLACWQADIFLHLR